MRIFGGEQISRLMTFFNFPEDQPLSHAMVSKAIEQAQVKVEGYNFDIRKHLVDFDDVLNKQREIIYRLRRNILTSQKANKFKEVILDIFKEEFSQLVNSLFSLDQKLTDDEIERITQDINLIVPVTREEIKKHLKETASLVDYLTKVAADEYAKREKKYGKKLWDEITRAIFLSTVDKYWTDHLTAIEDLREGINLRGYAQLDPLVEYKNEAFTMFERLVSDINYEATRRLFKIEIKNEANLPVAKQEETVIYKSASAIDPFKQQTVSPTQSTLTTSQKQENPVVEEQGFKITPPGEKARKLGRNDPCWCGSGKKYKRCHWPN
jgi:preprotein translocase subunit SecA